MVGLNVTLRLDIDHCWVNWHWPDLLYLYTIIYWVSYHIDCRHHRIGWQHIDCDICILSKVQHWYLSIQFFSLWQLVLKETLQRNMPTSICTQSVSDYLNNLSEFKQKAQDTDILIRPSLYFNFRMVSIQLQTFFYSNDIGMKTYCKILLSTAKMIVRSLFCWSADFLWLTFLIDIKTETNTFISWFKLSFCNYKSTKM